MNATKNHYYIWIQPYSHPIAWDISLASPVPGMKYLYFSRVFQELEKKFSFQGLTFYLTYDNLQELPSYGDNVVAIIIGDESCRVPRYKNQVLAIFKCYGTKPTSLVQWSTKNPSITFSSSMKFIFDRARWIQFEIESLRKLLFTTKSLHDVSQDNIVVIPLGYDNQSEFPIKEIRERKYDVSFMGSISHRTRSRRISVKNLIRNPKEISRHSMMQCLVRLKEKNGFNVLLESFSSFFDPNKANSDEYSRILMESKICLAPQGTSRETFRFFEGMRYGCIVITESLPEHWFYKGSPAITISSWQELESLMSTILADADLMTRKHEESLAWWHSHCSEEVLAEYIYKNLKPLLPTLRSSLKVLS